MFPDFFMIVFFEVQRSQALFLYRLSNCSSIENFIIKTKYYLIFNLEGITKTQG